MKKLVLWISGFAVFFLSGMILIGLNITEAFEKEMISVVSIILSLFCFAMAAKTAYSKKEK